MQVEDFLNQTVNSSDLKRKYKAAKANPVPPPTPRQDSVTISSAARAVQAKAMEEAERPAFAQYKTFMDKLLGRGVVSGPKSLKEKLEELAEKIKQLKGRLSEVMANAKISDSEKSNQVKGISSQIQALENEMAELGKQAAEDAQEG